MTADPESMMAEARRLEVAGILAEINKRQGAMHDFRLYLVVTCIGAKRL